MEPNVQKTLENLHDQLNRVRVDDSTKQAHLNQVTQTLRTTLDQPDKLHSPGLRDHLENAALLFSADHPEIASAVRTAIDILVEAGF